MVGWVVGGGWWMVHAWWVVVQVAGGGWWVVGKILSADASKFSNRAPPKIGHSPVP